jgi:hypothetical protein
MSSGKTWVEKILEKWGDDKERLKKELSAIIKRSGINSIYAAREVLSREELQTRDVLYWIIQRVKVGGIIKEKEAEEIREEAARIAKERGYIDEKFLFVIIDNITSKKLLKEIAKEYLAKKTKVSNELLKQIILHIPGLKNRAGQRLLKQTKNTDDLLIIEEELTGKLQREALKLHWKLGMELEDFVWLMGFVLTSTIAEENWAKGEKEGVVEKLSLAELYEISYYTESKKIKEMSLNWMWIKRENLQEEKHIEYLRDNANLVTIENPDTVREWANEKLLSIDTLSLEMILNVREKTRLLPLKLEANKSALTKIQKEIKDLLKPGRTLHSWDRERLKFLKKKNKEIKLEILLLQNQLISQEKAKEEAEPQICQI